MSKTQFRLPPAPKTIEKGFPLKSILGQAAVEALAHNITLVYRAFESEYFCHQAMDGLTPLGLMARGQHIADVLHACLPQPYEQAIDLLLATLTPSLETTEGNGLQVFFYLPHVLFVSRYGLDPVFNNGYDPFDLSMQAQYALTKRFSAEFSLRPFLIEQPSRTLAQLTQWQSDADPHVRRLCSEGPRPRLPWAKRIPALIKDPSPVLPLLEALKDDPSLYVRRSVANHLGDIAKDHPELACQICERWLVADSAERKWLIRHALRHQCKKGNKQALSIRAAASV